MGIGSRLAAAGRFHHFLASGTKALLETKVLPRKPVFEQEGTCLDPPRRMICRLNLIQDHSTTTTELGWLLFHRISSFIA